MLVLRIRRILQGLRRVDSRMITAQSNVVGRAALRWKHRKQEIAADVYADSAKLGIT